MEINSRVYVPRVTGPGVKVQDNGKEKRFYDSWENSALQKEDTAPPSPACVKGSEEFFSHVIKINSCSTMAHVHVHWN